MSAPPLPTFKPSLTKTQRANLNTLANHLDTVRPHLFRMDRYSSSSGVFPAPHECNTVACAVGHGVAAGIPIREDDLYWMHYRTNFIEGFLHCPFPRYLFSEEWSGIDDTPQGAATRIREVLAL